MTQVEWTTDAKTPEGLLEAANEETIKPLPWQCWDIPGFKACHEEAGNKAYRKVVDVEGIYPESELYQKFYPLFRRNYVLDCQAHFACTYGALKLLREAAEDHKSRGFLSETKKPWFKWVATVGVLGAGWWWYKSRKG